MMTNELTTILVGSAAILAAIIIWVGAIVYIFVNTAHRNLPAWQQVTWRALAFVPLVGLLLYLFFRWLAGPNLADSGEKAARPEERVTILKPPPAGTARELPTIPAAEYMRVAAGQNGVKAGRSPEQANGRPRHLHLVRLSVLEGPHVGQKFGIDQLPACIGRGSGCPIRLDGDRGVSRRHAELYQQGRSLRLRDLGSTHGTRVNGLRINDHLLKSGDQIQVGYSMLQVKSEILQR